MAPSDWLKTQSYDRISHLPSWGYLRNYFPYQIVILALYRYSYLLSNTSISPGCRAPADVVFAIDSSGSVGRRNFNKLVDFVREMIEQLNVELCSYRQVLHIAISFIWSTCSL